MAWIKADWIGGWLGSERIGLAGRLGQGGPGAEGGWTSRNPGPQLIVLADDWIRRRSCRHVAGFADGLSRRWPGS